MTQWDATSLITCAKFQMDGRLVLDYALDAARIVVTTEVQQETVQVFHSSIQCIIPGIVPVRLGDTAYSFFLCISS